MSAEIAIPRTLPEPRPRRGRPTNEVVQQRREEGLFWIARQILRAMTDAERAAILLRVPDLVLTQKSGVLTEACQACRFTDGVGYIAARAAATSATRDEDGRMPEDTLRQLEFWRRGLVALAQGGPS